MSSHRRRKSRPHSLFSAVFCLLLMILIVLIIRLTTGIALSDNIDREAAGSGTDSADYSGLSAETNPADNSGQNSAAVSSMTNSTALGNWNLILVNDNHKMSADIPPDLATLANGEQVDSRIYDALTDMLSDGERLGLSFYICSGYRSFEKQTELFEQQCQDLLAQGYSRTMVEQEAKTNVAEPGASEHHLGLAVDIVATDYQLLDEQQADTAEAAWLMNNCHRYGFILRYPPGTQAITGIIYEPWHYRYVGKEAAAQIKEQNITLEEYLGVYP